MIRAALYEAANILLERTTRWFWLKAWAMGVAKRRGKARVKVALNRRLGVIMHAYGWTAASFAGSAKMWTLPLSDARILRGGEPEKPDKFYSGGEYFRGGE